MVPLGLSLGRALGLSTSMGEDRKAEWLKRAQGVALVANALWVLQHLLPVLIAVNAVFALVWILVRQGSTEPTWVWLAYGAAMLAALGWAFWRSRGRFLDEGDALQRLETALGLGNALSAAREGAVAWPPLPPEMVMPFQFSARRVWPPLLASGALLLAGLLVPVAISKPSPEVEGAQQPIAWDELEVIVEALEENEVVAEQSVDDLRQKLDELQAQPVEQWLTQSSMEAGESLRDQTMMALRETARNLHAAAATLEQMREQGLEMAPQDAQALETAVGQALENLRAGELPPKAELLQQLADAGSCQACSNLSAEAYEQLRAQLAENGEKLALLAELSEAELMMVVTVTGAGVSRGPGVAPKYLNEDPSPVAPVTVETLTNSDRSQAALGDLVGLQEREANPDESPPVYSVEQGEAAAVGRGGDVVWKNQLTPEERELLEAYFE